MKTPQTPIRAWHFLPSTSRTRYSAETVAVGTILKAKGDIELCSNGLHASRRLIDALRYAPGPLVCRVEVWGDIEEQDDKLAGRSRKVLAMADATKVLLHFAADCAERALLRIKSPDPRSVAAVQAVRDYADAKITAAPLRDFRVAALEARSAADAAAAADAADAYAAAAAAYAAYAAADAAAYADAAAADAAAYAAAAAKKKEQEWQDNALSKACLELLGLNE